MTMCPNHTKTHYTPHTHTVRPFVSPVRNIGAPLPGPGHLQLTLTDVQTNHFLEVWSQEPGQLAGPTAQVRGQTSGLPPPLEITVARGPNLKSLTELQRWMAVSHALEETI